MTKFEMIKYHSRSYPDGIPLRIQEIAGHVDIENIKNSLEISLHTEYSYGKRKFDSELINRFPELVNAQKEGVPQLWKNEKWAIQFAEFILSLIKDDKQLGVIEIHPPFSDYTDLDTFIRNYSLFEKTIKRHFPNVKILIENRCGSIYKGGKFIVSKTSDLIELVELIKSENLDLKIAYDIPQIYTAHNVKRPEQYLSLLNDVGIIRDYIGGVHLWGKRVSESGRKVAHCGDLDSYFGDENLKQEFLKAFKEVFNDDTVRKMVLEVNSGNEDLNSIVNDLLSVGIEFV